ncbi:ribosome biogenesis GTP-binding protein YihA/YsxC [Alicyclobacillus tolerans]|uniref:ribosome biogenesis GTP-binding protein YihA/YsxC n=1 Tax=Alicyclobacillus tolerans TaxID=90970 RepID=UPI001F027426|nr:ribosome biogenesis GTP-binding protein YihA/YsxC [Alicyclobacillus tolerans]MCF8563532.1 ribosome biogenesis GTP-binding protein YihA/YsxC [Alicyclobacillus tolerans]
MIVRSAEFELGAVQPVQWPKDGLPEFAFIGRSNVGKSSLLNRLLNRKSLARVSGKPGKTQEINFFRINDAFRLVDLPGYGYAAVSKTSRSLFAKRIETYLRERQPLIRILQLIDIRHPPMKNDIEAHQWLTTLGVPVCIVATKRDKLSGSKVNPAVKVIEQTLASGYPILPVSSEKNVGIEELWSLLETDLAAFEQNLAPTQGDGLVGDNHAGENE